jgi:hypothetical protein
MTAYFSSKTASGTCTLISWSTVKERALPSFRARFSIFPAALQPRRLRLFVCRPNMPSPAPARATSRSEPLGGARGQEVFRDSVKRLTEWAAPCSHVHCDAQHSVRRAGGCP